MADQVERIEYGPKPTRARWYGLGVLILGGFIATAEWPKPLAETAATAASAAVGSVKSHAKAAALIPCWAARSWATVSA